ncbi:MAG: class I mannose-6-phosphate isomerase [Novosphingobium sp.]|nr:class I mannose-6-phosphate isomerase [Novosphingobium sp.]
MVEKPWGKDVLPPPFASPEGQRIGEVWFEPQVEMSDILVKYIFTSEKLSVQVHPNDVQAKALGESDGGKDECWLVIDAEPGATLGIGFRERVDPDTIKRAALDGSIEGLMEWYPVREGDFFYIPAGTVHAIGRGVSLIEIQQNSDITYRLFDYGRPRELHLDKGLAVASGMPYDLALRQDLSLSGSLNIVDGPFFSVERIEGLPSSAMLSAYDGPVLVLPCKGKVVSGGVDIMPGACGLASSARNLDFQTSESCLLIATGKRIVQTGEGT